MNFVEAIGRRGYALRNTQDAAHELYHAITCGVRLERDGGAWMQREELNTCIETKFPGIERWWNEVEARVVERLVCERLGKETELLTFEAALMLSIHEAANFGVPHTSFERTVEYAKRFRSSKRARAAVDLMLAYALAEERADRR